MSFTCLFLWETGVGKSSFINTINKKDEYKVLNGFDSIAIIKNFKLIKMINN